MRRACPLCGSVETVPRWEKAGLHYRQCTGCTLVFAGGGQNANLRASMEEYEPAYRQYFDGGVVDDLNLDAVLAWIETRVQLDDSRIRLLDVGAGSGRLLRRLRATRSCQASGLEPSAALADAYDLAELGVRSIGLAELARVEPGVYDVVTVLDVIEHVADAAEFVRALGTVTRSGGLVFLSTPNARGWLARLLGRRWHHVNPYHYCLYARQSLAAAARIGGCDVVEVRHPSKRMAVAYLVNYAMNFGMGTRTAIARVPSTWAVPVNVGDILSTVWRRV